MSDAITKILREFNIPLLVASENGMTIAEIAMAEEIASLRAENARLRDGLQVIVDADGFWDAPSLARDLLDGKPVP